MAEDTLFPYTTSGGLVVSFGPLSIYVTNYKRVTTPAVSWKKGYHSTQVVHIGHMRQHERILKLQKHVVGPFRKSKHHFSRVNPQLG